MANLSTILINRVPQSVRDQIPVESNISTGRTWVFHSGNSQSSFPRGVCWKPPGTGTAIVEIWGAGGSGGGGCCCFSGIPGNPGGYVKKTLCVTPTDYICGNVGNSCGNAGGSNFRGCSEATCIVTCTIASGCICLCAQGGSGGCSLCNPSSSSYCCFVAQGYCNTLISGGCGIICNSISTGAGCAFGGDINCTGCRSCVTFWVCEPASSPNLTHIAYPAGIFSKEGGWITYQDTGCWTDGQFPSLMPFGQALMSITGLGLGYTQGAQMSCWSSNTQCGCYQYLGCHPFVPYGMPGASSKVDGGQRGWGQRGGHGALRITYIGS